MTNAQSKQRIPRITKENMDDGDFSKLAAEINAYLAEMVVKQEADSGEVMSEGDVNKIKRSFFTTALNSIFFSDDDATDKVRVYLLEPREDGSTVVGMIAEDTEEYHATAGFMIAPLTYRRFQPFVVKTSKNGDVDYDAAWHALFYFLQLKFSGRSSTKAHQSLKRLRIAEDEGPLGLSTRLVRLVVRVNRAARHDHPLETGDWDIMPHGSRDASSLRLLAPRAGVPTTSRIGQPSSITGDYSPGPTDDEAEAVGTADFNNIFNHSGL
ncbi:hypothetical protein CYMTET_28446 [Cymbomonas tetramitiformis]|uniref:Uncharacterized protein n=1 Tax=Cymbomonas tetramitiformis TaxID=36881 RepID=A0AAE0KVX7_9CHLO|nr:hypothetical protein CYMTET_28446 [Cymbomonas tetramitiformis]